MSEPSAPLISIILPVYNSEQYIERSIASIRESTFKQYELIAIDDSSTDTTYELLKSLKPDILLKTDRNHGPCFARNLGVAHANGDILYFHDADVVVFPDTLQKAYDNIAAKKHDCVIGLYSISHPNKNICSLYKNSWIRFSYLESPEDIDWFFTAVGTVRKSIWQANPEFEIQLCNKKGGGDIEYGKTLKQNGYSIFLDKNMEVIHLKAFTLYELLRNDLFRSFGYSRASLARNRSMGALTQKGYANISGNYVGSVFLAGLILLSGMLSYRLWILVMVVYGWHNRRFIGFLAENFSVLFAFKVIFVMFLDHVVCGFGVLGAVIEKIFFRGNSETK